MKTRITDLRFYFEVHIGHRAEVLRLYRSLYICKSDDENLNVSSSSTETFDSLEVLCDKCNLLTRTAVITQRDTHGAVLWCMCFERSRQDRVHVYAEQTRWSGRRSDREFHRVRRRRGLWSSIHRLSYYFLCSVSNVHGNSSKLRWTGVDIVEYFGMKVKK